MQPTAGIADDETHGKPAVARFDKPEVMRIRRDVECQAALEGGAGSDE